jgi:hypothetical protein
LGQARYFCTGYLGTSSGQHTIQGTEVHLHGSILYWIQWILTVAIYLYMTGYCAKYRGTYMAGYSIGYKGTYIYMTGYCTGLEIYVHGWILYSTYRF